MKVKIKKLHPDAVVPKYGTSGASGFDFVAVEETIIRAGETGLIKTGLSIAIELNPLEKLVQKVIKALTGKTLSYELQVRPRSGLSLKTGLRVANAPGTVDFDYRGEICVIMSVRLSNNDVMAYCRSERNGTIIQNAQVIKKGDRIAQGIICPIFQVEFEVVDNLDDTTRGAGGFGSTGK